VSIEDLPKRTHGGARLTKSERKHLEEWVIREGWTREKTIKKQFEYGNSMPLSLCAPGVPHYHWGGNGKMICVMCGYVTMVTNICRQCPEMPADAELTGPRYCYTHKMVHGKEEAWMAHRAIPMVVVS